MKKRFTKGQITGVLKEGEAGMKIADVCRKHGVIEAPCSHPPHGIRAAKFLREAFH